MSTAIVPASKYKIGAFDRFILAIAPTWGVSRIRAKAAVRSYEAAGNSRRTSAWKRTSADANAASLGALAPLREYSRDLVRNNPWAKRGVQVIATNTIGWGIDAKAVGESDLSKEATKLWQTWSRKTSVDYDGLLSFSGIQRQAMECIVTSGEVLIVRYAAKPVDGLPVPVRLRVLEPDFIDRNVTGKRDGNPVIEGIETDGNGRRVAYWLFQQHPGASVSNYGSKSVRVPAEDVIHIFRPDRPGQMRGVPWMATVIAKLNDLDDYEDAKLMQQKVAAMFAVFVDSEGGMGSGLSPTDPENPELEELEPGSVNYLKPGQKVSSMQPPSVAGHGDFSAATLRAIAAGLGITFEDQTGDYSKVNFSSARMGRLAHYANVYDWRWNMVIPKLCMGVWAWVMETAKGLNGWPEIPESSWSSPPMPMISPEKEGLAYMRLVRSGFMTLADVISERGNDPATQIENIKAMNKMLDDAGVVLDSDPRHTSAAGLAQEATSTAADDSKDEADD